MRRKCIGTLSAFAIADMVEVFSVREISELVELLEHLEVNKDDEDEYVAQPEGCSRGLMTATGQPVAVISVTRIKNNR